MSEDRKTVLVVDDSGARCRMLMDSLRRLRDAPAVVPELEQAQCDSLAATFRAFNLADAIFSLYDPRRVGCDALLAEWKRLAVEERRLKKARERARQRRRYRQSHKVRRSKGR